MYVLKDSNNIYYMGSHLGTLNKDKAKTFKTKKEAQVVAKKLEWDYKAIEL